MPRAKARHAGWLLSVLLTLPLAAQQRALNPGNPSTIEDFKAGDQNREVQQRATDLLHAMNASPGDWVADVGAGAGYYAMRLSTIVGPQGKVYAEEISNPALKSLDLRVEFFDPHNVDAVKGEDDSPMLHPE